MTVFCVDDSNTIRMLVKKALEPEHIQVIEAENGKVALEHPKIKESDLFLVDINMPEMNGFEFVGKMKEDADLQSKPVVFLTTESSLEKKSEGKGLGGDGWMVKPFEPPALVKVIKMLLE